MTRLHAHRCLPLWLNVTLSAWLLLGAPSVARSADLVVATVNNGHMLTLQRLAPEFERLHPGVRVKWITLEESALRQQVTRDIATRGGQFDVTTVGGYEAHVWSTRGWLKPITPSRGYDVDDLLPVIREALARNGQLYALPFYGESVMTMVRTDLLQQAGITLPPRPTWDQIAQAAARLHQPAQGVSGICLRGKPGWGENMTLVSTMANTFGGQWFDMDWRPQLDTPPWRRAVSLYADLLRRYGPPGAEANGYNENLALFSQGRCAIWVDATVAGAFVNRPQESRVAGRVGFLQAPVGTTPKGAQWLWTWALAIPNSSKNAVMAQAFIEWATSKDYLMLAARAEGWAAVPSGTRRSTYAINAFRQANLHADVELAALAAATQNDPTLPRSPYVGIQWVGIPEFQAIGTVVGQQVSTLLSNRDATVEKVLAQSQRSVERKVREAGYLKD